MLAKPIKYTDYDGNEREEIFYFYLNKARILKLEAGTKGGIVETINRIVAARDNQEIMNLFTSILKAAYGVKSPDGRRFIQTDEVWDEFEQTEAYSELLMELVTDADRLAQFINSIMPKIPDEQRNKIAEIPQTQPSWHN